MKLKNLIVAAALPMSFLFACGGTASDSSSDNASNGDGDGDGDGDQTTPSSSSKGKEPACAEFCEAIADCNGGEVETCTDSCTESSTTSRSGQDVINACFDADLCAADVSETDALGALLCVITELDDVELSAEAETYCSDSVDTINDCLGSAPADTGFGSCEDTIGIASDELLEGVNACAQKDCDAVEACLQVELLKAIPLDTLILLGAEEEPSPAILADLLPIIVVFGQLGLSDTTGLGGDVPFGPMPPPNGMGGANGR